MFKMLSYTLFISLILIGIAFGESVPNYISYQGHLSSTNNNIPLSGQYPITFTIFDQAEGGQAKWSETHPTVIVEKGIFAVILGTYNTLEDSVFSGPDRFLEISVNGEIVSTRTRFTSVGYTYRTSSIDGASGGKVKGSIIITSPNQTATNLPGAEAYGEPIIDINVDSWDFGSISFYDPADTYKSSALAGTKSFEINRDGWVMFDPNGIDTTAILTKDITGDPTISFYDPADTKKSAFATGTKKFSINSSGMYMFGNTGSDTAIKVTADEFGSGQISFYEPADTKSAFAGTSKKIEMNRFGLYMFGQTIFDTSLIVAPNGDIISVGQITMGENSSPGLETSVLGFNNTASGDSSTIGGGSNNITFGSNTVIAGGYLNTANGNFSIISGGSENITDGQFATIIGGFNNHAEGDYSSILGGSLNRTLGIFSLSAGYRADAAFDGSFVWADYTEEDFASTAPNQFLIRASGGVGIGTNSPTGLLDVAGGSGDGSVNLPDDAISSPEIFDEPGLSSSRQSSAILLSSNGIMTDLTSTTITIPAAGYIMLSGGGTFIATATNKNNQVIVQIDETSGGGMVAPYFVKVGSGEYDSPSSEHFFSINTQRIYYKEAGTYTFILEAMPNPVNNPSASSTIENSFITAMFVPTAYGAVQE